MSMNREEAINRIENHMEVHGIGEYPHIALKEALDMAITALRPVSREQVEKVWRGEWEDMREAYKDVPKRRCSRCKNVFIGLDTPFCEVCGAPMTDEAVDMEMERMEALRDET